MSEFPVRTGRQLPELLQAYRKQSGLTQSEVARRLGVTQQNLSSLERNADKVSAERLIELLNILGVELVLRKIEAAPSDALASPSDTPQW
ncbi:helix-turn-helix transcriptional regulator [Herbaspirillum seropedicae]|uniref:Transcription regulator protein n=1 Tax=Herbaspirillum seropedicae (strain SmR1) TaxID=757424 RepID=D8IX61_HERSS|nr:helix-turn-helix transcriptional regulator [Herbaspirillum seropedicae]ADJ61936.1 transcription regulator protein [Herbaspirillum seropedicae SmR1]AKN64121.1 XRE family transcriptional regulator [Herbaspirillum seropedicae]AON52714.1 transcription regulator protein [Herbaspirillum seropedicae]MDR6395599.1 HTH-type transcriptional regulator/antitoxin HipB [Herbaspirillum seropedicae]NQE29507.1 XRE family transcriptional regulator [Herbaspirillum seropedicae]